MVYITPSTLVRSRGEYIPNLKIFKYAWLWKMKVIDVIERYDFCGFKSFVPFPSLTYFLCSFARHFLAIKVFFSKLGMRKNPDGYKFLGDFSAYSRFLM